MIKNDPKNYITIGMAQANRRAEWLAELANRPGTSGENPMTIETELPAVKDLAPERVERLWWFLHIMSKSGGTTDASDTKWNWINAFCDDFEPDTFNLASNLKLIRVTHDADYDSSTATLTDGGRALIAYFDRPPKNDPGNGDGEAERFPTELLTLTFAVQHNPNCPSPWLVRLPGNGPIDMLPYGDPLGRVRHQTGDILGFGKTFGEAARVALSQHRKGSEADG
ncbi:hypothetical protein [Rhizobium johnstonii]|uniref:hypothetical protein n=1 Tax=Rhizobium johnstonii TaxID=3019933 RepID=UPI003F991CCB